MNTPDHADYAPKEHEDHISEPVPVQYTVEPATSRKVVHADARNRATRSLIQNAIAAIIVGALGAVALVFVNATTENVADYGWWITAGMLALQGGLASLGSYIQRRIEEYRP